VFLFGTADDANVWHLFSKVLALVADVPTIRRRIDARPNQFGKAPEELAAVLGWQASYEADTAGTARSSSTRHARWAKS
jgi:hypothetical protein